MWGMGVGQQQKHQTWWWLMSGDTIHLILFLFFLLDKSTINDNCQWWRSASIVANRENKTSLSFWLFYYYSHMNIEYSLYNTTTHKLSLPSLVLVRIFIYCNEQSSVLANYLLFYIWFLLSFFFILYILNIC